MVHRDGPLTPQPLTAPHAGVFAQPAEVSGLFSEDKKFISVAQSGPTLWEPMNCSVPGLPVHRQLPEFI